MVGLLWTDSEFYGQVHAIINKMKVLCLSIDIMVQPTVLTYLMNFGIQCIVLS